MMWLFIGIACIVIDFFLIQSLVLLFFGLGAVTTALALSYGLVVKIEHQVILFLASSTAWCLLLWKPLRKIRKGQAFNNLIGQEVELTEENLLPGEIGNGKWSGTNVKIQLTEDSKPAKLGERLTVIEVNGITFKVTNKE